jgi:hypothetical protein
MVFSRLEFWETKKQETKDSCLFIFVRTGHDPQLPGIRTPVWQAGQESCHASHQYHLHLLQVPVMHITTLYSGRRADCHASHQHHLHFLQVPVMHITKLHSARGADCHAPHHITFIFFRYLSCTSPHYIQLEVQTVMHLTTSPSSSGTCHEHQHITFR